MKKIFLISSLIAVMISCTAKGDKPSYTQRNAKVHANRQALVKKSADEVEIENLLGQTSKMLGHKTNDEIIIFIARHFIGIPYVAHTLDRTDTEKMVINLHQLDCTTFVENVVALSLCTFRHKYSYKDYVQMLTALRYRNGKLSYENRLHYYQWWVSDNEKMGFVKEISSNIPPFTAIQRLKINYMSTNYSYYDMLRSHPERISAIKAIEDETNGTIVRYIPKAQLNNSTLLQSTIHDGDIIAITTNKKNLDTTHLGIAVWHDDGLHLINASSLQKNGKKVVEATETLQHYLLQRPYNPGIRVARINSRTF